MSPERTMGGTREKHKAQSSPVILKEDISFSGLLNLFMGLFIRLHRSDGFW